MYTDTYDDMCILKKIWVKEWQVWIIVDTNNSYIPILKYLKDYRIKVLSHMNIHDNPLSLDMH